MIIQIVKFRSGLSFEEVLETAKDRASEFRAVPGLLQKYYVRTKDDEQYAGFYIWEEENAMAAYRDSDLAAGIPKAYQVLEPPDVEIYDVAFKLRE